MLYDTTFLLFSGMFYDVVLVWPLHATFLHSVLLGRILMNVRKQFARFKTYQFQISLGAGPPWGSLKSIYESDFGDTQNLSLVQTSSIRCTMSHLFQIFHQAQRRTRRPV